MADQLTAETTELLQTLIRNQCVNDGTATSGNEHRNVAVLKSLLDRSGADIDVFEPEPGRQSLVARLAGTDPTAPSLCLMGHTDVVPASPVGWRHDPFGGELVAGEVWGRGAVDMLNLTASMAVVFNHIARTGQRPTGDLLYFAVADEEAGGVYGAKALLADEWDSIACDYVVTEYGGFPTGPASNRSVLVTTAEKGVAWQRVVVEGTSGHGSMPFGADNALVKAAEVVRRLDAYRPSPQLNQMWSDRIRALDLAPDLTARLLDPSYITDALAELPLDTAAVLHACCHTTFSPNVVSGGSKTNTIPDRVTIDLDIRTLPGENEPEVEAHLKSALGDLFEAVTIEPIVRQPSTESPAGPNLLWDALGDAIAVHHPEAVLVPSIVSGATDARFFRERGAIAYGAGLLSPELDTSTFLRRFHGSNERIDLESLRLTTQLWCDLIDRMWSTHIPS